MSDQNDQDSGKGRLSLRPGGRLDLGKTVDGGSVRQSFSHGRSKVVQVEVVKKRPALGAPAPVTGPAAKPAASPPARAHGGQTSSPQPAGKPAPGVRSMSSARPTPAASARNASARR
jgi:translation initiation factor IF-2